jgi:hypothetical protein
MALKPEEQQELDQLEGKYGTSVLDETRPKPTPLQQFGKATVEALPEIGGLVGGAVATAATRSPVAGAEARTLMTTLLRGIAGTGAGAATGTVAKQQVEALTGKQEPLTKQYAEQLSNAMTEMALDAGGNVVFKLGGDLFKIAKDKLPKLGLFSTKTTPDVDMKRQVQELLEKEGLGGLTRYQVKPTATSSVVESVGRGAVTGKGVFADLEEANTVALKSKRDKILNEISPKIVDDVEAGANYKDAIKDAQSQLSVAANDAYQVITDAGKNVSVNVGVMANQAKARLEEAAKISVSGSPKIALSDNVVAKLREISDLKENITFSQAHQFRSDLNAQLRAVKSEFGANDPVVAVLTQNIKAIGDAMDSAASRLNPRLKKAYDETSAFYRESITELFPEALAKLNNKTAERVGETIFAKGNVTEINDFYKSLERAKTINPNLDVDSVKNNLQRGYISGLIGAEGGDTTISSLLALEKNLKDKKFLRTFDTAVDNKEIKDNLLLLVNAAKLSQQKPSNAFSLALSSAQAYNAQTLLTGLAAGATGYASYTGDLGLLGTATATGVLLTPRVLARFATSKEGVKKLIAAEQSFGRAKAATGDEAKRLAIKTVGMMNEAYRTAGVTEEDFKDSSASSLAKPMTPEEQQELEMLEQKYK